MPSKNISLPGPYPTGRGTLYQTKSWVHSPRVNGKLKLQPNNYNLNRIKCVDFLGKPDIWGQYPWGPDCRSGMTVFRGDNPVNSAIAVATARFNGKLREGGASLGVSLASWKQSSDMINQRGSKLGGFFTSAAALAAAHPNRIRSWNVSGVFKDISAIAHNGRFVGKNLKRHADNYLESVFGWVPLAQDLIAVATTVCDVPKSPWVRAASEKSWKYSETVMSFGAKLHSRSECKVRVVIAAEVRISNPNLYLLNRLGVINPAAVAWDLVPWSFVVNMFSNIGQILNGLTADVGLDVQKANTTTTYVGQRVDHNQYPPNATPWERSNSWAISTYDQVQKTRVVGAVPRAPLVFHVPDFSPGLGAIALALGVQKLAGIRVRSQ